MKNGNQASFGRWPETLIILQSIIYGIGDPISKIAFDVMPAYTVMIIRYFIAFAVTALLFRKQIVETLRTAPIKAWLLPSMFIGLSYVFGNVALSLTEATSVAFLRSLSVVITPLIAYIIFRAKCTWKQIMVQVLVLPGTYLLCVKGGLSGFGTGEVLSLVAAVLAASTLIASRNYLSTIDPGALTSLMAGCTAVIALVASFIFNNGPDISTCTLPALGIILYLALACTGLGYLMQNMALRHITARSVALIQSLCPVMTAVFSFIILGERLSLAGILGGAIIIACLVLASLIQEPQK